MKAGTSTPGEDRESGPITRSGICQRVDDLPQAGHSRRDQVHTDNDGESLFHEKGQSDSPPKEAAGRPPDRGAGLGSRYGGGATIPVCGDCPAPPKKKRSPGQLGLPTPVGGPSPECKSAHSFTWYSENHTQFTMTGSQ